MSYSAKLCNTMINLICISPFFLITYLLERQSDIKRGTHRRSGKVGGMSHWFPLQMLLVVEARAIQSHSHKLHLGHLCIWQEPKYLSCHSLSSRHMSRKLGQLRLELGTPEWDMGVPNSGLTHCTTNASFSF